jgi:hypothetical protein
MSDPLSAQLVTNVGSEVVKQGINALVETYLKPHLAVFFKNNELDRRLTEQAVTNKFEEYLLRTYNRHSHISVLALQNQWRAARRNESVYAFRAMVKR